MRYYVERAAKRFLARTKDELWFGQNNCDCFVCVARREAIVLAAEVLWEEDSGEQK